LQFVEIAPNFPAECRHVRESLGAVYYNDAMAREQSLSAEDRLPRGSRLYASDSLAFTMSAPTALSY